MHKIAAGGWGKGGGGGGGGGGVGRGKSIWDGEALNNVRTNTYI
jgi:hypothetical protein